MAVLIPQRSTRVKRKQKQDAAAAEQGNAGDNAEPAPPEFAQVEWKLVDKSKALAENPKLIEVVNKTNASDPWSAAAQSYFTIGSKAHMLAFKHTIDLHKAEHDKNPTFEQFDTMMKSANVKLKGLYPWQVYAYDAKDGSIVILENAEEKKRRYEEAGITE